MRDCPRDRLLAPGQWLRIKVIERWECSRLLAPAQPATRMVWDSESGIGQTQAISMTAIHEVGGKPLCSEPGRLSLLCELNAER